MKHNINADQIEKLRVTYFNQINDINVKIRMLKKRIKEENEKLDKQQDLEKEYQEMLYSECTGKGNYYDAIMLPSDIKQEMLDIKDKTEERLKQDEKLLQLAEECAKSLENRYKQLSETQIERLKTIKESKNTLKKYKTALKNYEKKHETNLTKVKKLDKKYGLDNHNNKVKETK